MAWSQRPRPLLPRPPTHLEPVQLAPWSHVGPCHRMSLYLISGLEAHECARLFVNGPRVWATGFLQIKIIWAAPFVRLFFSFFFFAFLTRRHPVGANAGACECARHAFAAGGRGEVQGCEIRRWFVGGDNEQSAIFAG